MISIGNRKKKPEQITNVKQYVREKTGRNVSAIFSYDLNSFIDYMYFDDNNVAHTDRYKIR